MNLEVGTKIVYTSAAGTRRAEVFKIRIAPTARPGFLNTWLSLTVPVQDGVKYEHYVTIPADDSSLKMFNVRMIGDEA